MKNYLLALSLLFILGSCVQKKNAVQEKDSENVISKTTQDTTEVRVREVKHGSSDQSKLDSIKQAKMKLKTAK